MVNIQSPTAEIRRGKKKKEEERTNHSMKIYMVSLLHRATIIKETQSTNHNQWPGPILSSSKTRLLMEEVLLPLLL